MFVLQYIGNYGFRTPCTIGLENDLTASRDLVANGAAGVDLVDIAVDFGVDDPSLRMLDGVHLNARGAERVASAVADAVYGIVDERES